MIAWLAARCDPPDYGKLIVYEFPKDKLVYRAVPDRGAASIRTPTSPSSSRSGTRWARG